MSVGVALVADTSGKGVCVIASMGDRVTIRLTDTQCAISCLVGIEDARKLADGFFAAIREAEAFAAQGAKK